MNIIYAWMYLNCSIYSYCRYCRFGYIQLDEQYIHTQAYLNYIRDEHGQHGERKTQDVEEREGHKGLFWSESLVRVVDVDQRVSTKCYQRHLNGKY